MDRKVKSRTCTHLEADGTAEGGHSHVREKKARSSKWRGQSLVELSLVLPVLMLLTLGTVDLGRMFYGYIQMTNAVREGAAVASHLPDEGGQIGSAIANHSANLPAGYTWWCDGCGAAEPGDMITINASWNFQPITFTFLDAFWGLGDPVSMSTHSTMKVL